jgi:hypothetical protein
MPDGNLRERIETILSKGAADMARQIADVFAATIKEAVSGGDRGVEREPVAGKGARGSPTRKSTRRGMRKAEITKWVPDSRARRVPKFVIEMTGLDTKKKILEKFGEVTFELGKPLPKSGK